MYMCDEWVSEAENVEIAENNKEKKFIENKKIIKK